MCVLLVFWSCVCVYKIHIRGKTVLLLLLLSIHGLCFVNNALDNIEMKMADEEGGMKLSKLTLFVTMTVGNRLSTYVAMGMKWMTLTGNPERHFRHSRVTVGVVYETGSGVSSRPLNNMSIWIPVLVLLLKALLVLTVANCHSSHCQCIYGFDSCTYQDQLLHWMSKLTVYVNMTVFS